MPKILFVVTQYTSMANIYETELSGVRSAAYIYSRLYNEPVNKQVK